MAKSYNATEYMYSSARIRAFETRIAGKEQISRLADADSVESVQSALGDFGFETVLTEDGRVDREETLLSVLKNGFAELEGMECADAVGFLKYQYDCNNVKSLIKCEAAGISAESMLLPLGSVSVEDAKKAFRDKDYAVFPQNMAAAIAEAEEAFAATGNPQKVDFLVDRAAFADMLDCARRCRIPLAERLVETKIDLVNAMMATRLIRMRLGAQAASIFDEVYVDGGSLNKETLTAALADEDKLAKALAYGNCSALAELIASGAELGALEKAADDIWCRVAREARYVPFGAEVAIGYIFALEYEVKNIRIILAGKEAGLSSDIIRERLRECYV